MKQGVPIYRHDALQVKSPAALLLGGSPRKAPQKARTAGKMVVIFVVAFLGLINSITNARGRASAHQSHDDHKQIFHSPSPFPAPPPRYVKANTPCSRQRSTCREAQNETPQTSSWSRSLGTGLVNLYEPHQLPPCDPAYILRVLLLLVVASYFPPPPRAAITTTSYLV